jgi:hypothetical protein
VSGKRERATGGGRTPRHTCLDNPVRLFRLFPVKGCVVNLKSEAKAIIDHHIELRTLGSFFTTVRCAAPRGRRAGPGGGCLLYAYVRLSFIIGPCSFDCVARLPDCAATPSVGTRDSERNSLPPVRSARRAAAEPEPAGRTSRNSLFCLFRNALLYKTNLGKPLPVLNAVPTGCGEPVLSV